MVSCSKSDDNSGGNSGNNKGNNGGNNGQSLNITMEAKDIIP